MAHTNGNELFWAMLKRGNQGKFHHFSEKHLNRYICEFAGRHNDPEADTIDMMARVAQGMVGKRLRYADLAKRLKKITYLLAYNENVVDRNPPPDDS